MNEATLIVQEIAIANLGWFFLSRIRRNIPFSPLAYCLIFLACSLAHLVIDTLEHNHIMMLMDLTFAAIFMWLIHLLWKKRQRKGRLAALGNKARAKIAEMKRRMAERPARPVLRPVPTTN